MYVGIHKNTNATIVFCCFFSFFFYGIHGLKLIEDINLLYVMRLAQEVEMIQKEKKYIHGGERGANGNFHWGAPSGSLLPFLNVV